RWLATMCVVGMLLTSGVSRAAMEAGRKTVAIASVGNAVERSAALSQSAGAGVVAASAGEEGGIVGLEPSGHHHKETISADVKAVRTMFQQLAASPSVDPRGRGKARVRIYLLFIDALSEVVWSGTDLTVGELTDEWWSATIAERRSYGACTSLS